MPPRQDDPNVTDLSRYRRDREQAAQKAAAPKKAASSGGGLMGTNPRAGLILVLVAVAIAAFYLLPRLV